MNIIDSTSQEVITIGQSFTPTKNGCVIGHINTGGGWMTLTIGSGTPIRIGGTGDDASDIALHGLPANTPILFTGNTGFTELVHYNYKD